ncbi:MAG: VWA domain-containing protein [Spirochaetales bacterium]|nr:VWA domain-containing protein [Spirochaetales bacterium]
MKRILCFFIIAAALSSPALAERYEGRPLIQLAILLDTSNSMDGLINQAKSQLWKIVAETGRTRYQGQRPVLEVALYEYGNDSLSMFSGYIRNVVPFTRDLDLMSQSLFQLATNGGSEYCGQVLRKANRELDWDRDPRTLKIVFIAGNEPFGQGPVNYVHAANESARKEITVNTIFCGNRQEGFETGWEHGAMITGGSYMNIDSDYAYGYIQAPQDDRIEELNRRLNETYLGYGAEGEEKKALQAQQDTNAGSMNRMSLLERAKVKSSASYSNEEWDLVDAYDRGTVSVDEVAEAQLPAEMHGMSGHEKEAFVREKLEQRKAIQAEIAALSTERDAYIKAQAEEQDNSQALDTAMIDALHHAAQKKGYELAQ